MAKVNLWSVMTDAHDRLTVDYPTKDDLDAVLKAAGGGSLFHNQEISLEVGEEGWCLRIFGTEQDGHVRLMVLRNGTLHVEREIERDGIRECRRLTF